MSTNQSHTGCRANVHKASSQKSQNAIHNWTLCIRARCSRSWSAGLGQLPSHFVETPVCQIDPMPFVWRTQHWSSWHFLGAAHDLAQHLCAVNLSTVLGWSSGHLHGLGWSQHKNGSMNSSKFLPKTETGTNSATVFSRIGDWHHNADHRSKLCSEQSSFKRIKFRN